MVALECMPAPTRNVYPIAHLECSARAVRSAAGSCVEEDDKSAAKEDRIIERDHTESKSS